MVTALIHKWFSGMSKTIITKRIDHNKRLDIQILRSIAVIAVIVYHTSPNLFPNGYLGVDVFFVISGFVIAKTLSNNFKNMSGSRSYFHIFVDFYRKRFYRLVPALSVALIFTCILMLIFIPSKFHINFFKLSLSALVGVANLGAMRFAGDDYFNALPNPVIHTWSLSVEAQLYLLAPIIFYVFKTHKSKILHAIFFLFLASGFLQLTYMNLNSSDKLSQLLFYSPIFRGSEFALGILAFKFSRKKSNNGNMFYLLLLCVSLFIPAKIYFLNVLVLFFTFFIIVLNMKLTDDKWVTKFALGIGNRSYSLYLIHLPILYVMEYSLLLNFKSSLVEYFVSYVLIFCLGFVLFELVENRYHIIRSETFTLGNIYSILVFLLSPVIILSTFLVFSTNNYISNSVVPPIVNFYQISPESDISSACNEFAGTPCVLNKQEIGNEKILLIGDSQAASIWKILSRLDYYSTQNIFDGSLIGCPFYLEENFKTNVPSSLLSNDCQTRNLNLIKWIKSNSPNLVIIKQAEPSGSLTTNEYSIAESYYLNALAWLKSINLNVLVIGPNPSYNDLDYSLTGTRYVWQNKEYPDKILVNYSFDPQSIGHNKRLQQAALSYGFIYQDLYQVFCADDICARGNEFGYFYVDNFHLSSLGAEQLLVYLNSKKIYTN